MWQTINRMTIADSKGRGTPHWTQHFLSTSHKKHIRDITTMHYTNLLITCLLITNYLRSDSPALSPEKFCSAVKVIK